MNIAKWFASLLVAVVSTTVGTGSIVIAQNSEESPAIDLSDIQLPPGWTAEDMQACIIAWTPGKMHEHLTEGVGTWHGKITMWMAPGAEPMTSECTSTVTSIMDGRFLKCEMKGEMPGMGPYHGVGTYGYDNVAQEFVSTWFDNHSTGIMVGKGELTPDGKTTTWEYTYSCPLTKGLAKMREVESITGPNTKTLESFMTDPKSGEEYQMMRIELTRK